MFSLFPWEIMKRLINYPGLLAFYYLVRVSEKIIGFVFGGCQSRVQAHFGIRPNSHPNDCSRGRLRLQSRQRRHARRANPHIRHRFRLFCGRMMDRPPSCSLIEAASEQAAVVI
jgi:hypothetical protein